MRKLPIIACLLLTGSWTTGLSSAQRVTAPDPQPAIVTGTVLDINGGLVPGAAVELDGAGRNDRLTVTSGQNGGFEFTDVQPEKVYHVTVSAPGFAEWTSNPITLTPGEYFILTGIQLRLATVYTSVVAVTPQQEAIHQVRVQETQRIVFGIIPNFYVNFDPHPEPMTAKLKFQLAGKTLTDPVSLAGFVLNAGIYQAAGWPGYRGGMAGYGQRLGATFAGGYAHVLIEDALLPSILHQDPRYFYQGTGTARSRLFHALSYAIFTPGDNGKRQINYSGIGGDLVSGALANAYYPQDERGAGLVLQGALIGTGGRVALYLGEEFVLNRHPPQR